MVKLIVIQSRYTPCYMEPEGSSQSSQQPANGSYPEADESSPHFSILFP